MTTDVDLTTFLQEKAAGAGVEQNKLAENQSASPCVVFFRRPSNQDLFLDGSPGLNTTEYDLEIYGTDIDAVETLGDALKTALHGFRGTMGATEVLGAFVSDHASDYSPKAEFDTDEGLNLASFALQIIHN